MECSVDNLDQGSPPVRTGTDRFTSRRHDVFSSLGELEKKHSAFLKVLSRDGSMEDQGLVKLDPAEENSEEISKLTASSRSHYRAQQNLGDTRDADFSVTSRRSKVADKRQSGSYSRRSQESNFKHPLGRPFLRRGRNQEPNFKKHPEKYTHYSLRDVSENDMSERSNSTAAFAFLEERRLQREKEENGEEVVFDTELAACSQGQIAFSRPNQKKTADVGQHEKGNRVQTSSATSSFISNFDDGETLQEDSLKGKTADTSTCTETPSDISDAKFKEGKSTISSFKSRKNNSIKRNHIRKKADDDDSD